ncbi:hypothetical protein BJF78_08660 [Pseudonocardia sp. CNS-139]|nr:hypothetical protein BJF78_08660 [Pseudonocardia sp. CNS-139]
MSTKTLKEEHRDRISEAAAAIADWPALWRDLLKLHVAGADGRCRGCLSAVRMAPRSPCHIAAMASHAAVIFQERALRN